MLNERQLMRHRPFEIALEEAHSRFVQHFHGGFDYDAGASFGCEFRPFGHKLSSCPLLRPYICTSLLNHFVVIVN